MPARLPRPVPSPSSWRRSPSRGAPDHAGGGPATIGIGRSPACDGQILVLEDMLGLGARVPKFVKKYAELGPAIEDAVGRYADEVRARVFPGPEHTYAPKAPKAP